MKLYIMTNNSPVISYDLLGKVPQIGMPGCHFDMTPPAPAPTRTRQGMLDQLKRTIEQHSSKTKPDCKGEQGCTLMSVVVEIGDPANGPVKQKIGHTGLGIGDDYYDLGPANGANFFGYDNSVGKYWHEEFSDKTSQIISNIDDIADNPTVLIEFCACAERTQNARNYWEDMYNKIDNGTAPAYKFWGLNCSTSVWDSLNIEYFDSRSPEELLLNENMLLSLGSNCGKSKGDKPYMTLIRTSY